MTVKNLKVSLEVLQQKARERTVKTQNVEYDLDTLVKKIKNKSIKLDPDYQRRHRWPVETSSKLIESLILNIPLPVIFISQDVDVDDEVEEATARYTVIDGQQRLTAIYDFLQGTYPLEGLEILEELNGAYYNDLPPFLTRRLEERTIKCLRIDSTVDAQVKFDIFERLNTGSVKLEAQELRNATVRGPFNDLIKELATTPSFRRLIQVDSKRPDESVKVQKMEDVELVLRFFALRGERYLTLKKGFKEFLTASQKEFNDWDEYELVDARLTFTTYMDFLDERIGATAFSKFKIENGALKKMSSFNAAVYDAVAIGLANSFSVDAVRARPNDVAHSFDRFQLTLFANNDFFSAVSGSVNDAAKVQARINAMAGFLNI